MLTAEKAYLTVETSYLGPATVLDAVGNRVQIELVDRSIWAQTALAFPYCPREGDVVLTVGHNDNWYVIGVLNASGPTRLTVPGDLEISAPRGRISLTSAQAVELRSAEVRISAKRLELLAQDVFEKFSNVTRWVRGVFQLRAGRLRTRLSGTYDLFADRILERARADVKIDGDKIRLG